MTTQDNFNYSELFTDYVAPLGRKFTVENQLENNISRTTIQKLKHNMYSNIEVSICGWRGEANSHDVWFFDGFKMSMKFGGLSLEQAVVEANILINN